MTKLFPYIEELATKEMFECDSPGCLEYATYFVGGIFMCDDHAKTTPLVTKE